VVRHMGILGTWVLYVVLVLGERGVRLPRHGCASFAEASWLKPSASSPHRRGGAKRSRTYKNNMRSYILLSPGPRAQPRVPSGCGGRALRSRTKAQSINQDLPSWGCAHRPSLSQPSCKAMVGPAHDERPAPSRRFDPLDVAMDRSIDCLSQPSWARALWTILHVSRGAIGTCLSIVALCGDNSTACEWDR